MGGQRLESRDLFALLPIVNPSFESPALPPGGTGFPAAWTGVGVASYYPPGAGQYPGGVTNGLNVAWNNGGGTMEQTLSSTLQPGTSYRLEIDIGNRLDVGDLCDYTIELRAGGSLLATGTNLVSPVPGTFQTAQLNYTSPAVVTPGQALTIRVLTGFNGIQTNYDNVRLDAIGAVADSYAATENVPLVIGDGTAPVIPYVVPAGQVGNQAFGGSLGMDFNVGASAITVTQLGVFDDGSNGLAVPLNAYIYDRTTQLPVAQISFPAGNTGTLIGGSRFLPLGSAVTLPAGFQGRVVGEGYGGTELNGNGMGAVPPWTTDSGGGAVTFLGGGFFGSAGAYPNGGDGGPANRYAAGTFMFGGGDPQSLLSNDIATTASAPGVFPTSLGGTVTISAGGGFTYNSPNSPPQGVVVNDTFTYTATTSRGPVVGTATVAVTGVNDPPVVTPIGPAIINEGDNLLLSGSATDPDQGETATLTYRWVVNGTAVSLSQNANISWATLITAGADDGAPGAGTDYTLQLIVTDAQGAIVGSNVSTLTILDVPIEVDTNSLPTDVLLGTTVDFPLFAIDPSLPDLASVTYLIDWNGDGDFIDAGDQTIVDNTGLGVTPQRVFNSPGNFSLNFAVLDASGVMSAVVPYSITVAQVIQDGDDISVGGSNTFGDKITVSLKSPGIISIKVNNTIYSALDINEFSTITIYGNGGADNITTTKLPIPVTVFGGPGSDYIAGTAFDDLLNGEGDNDRILGVGGSDTMDGGGGNDSMDGGVGNDSMFGGDGHDTMYGQAGDDVLYGDDPNGGSPGNDKMDGGLGNDLLHGGDGDDSMTGNSGYDVVLGDGGNDRVLGAAGRDVLIGGDGADNLDGGADEDILIGSATALDSDDVALLLLLDQWSFSTDGYEVRVANLQGGDLSPGGNVFIDDGAQDLLTGQTGRDWYLGSLSDNDIIRGRVGSGPDFEILDN